MRLLSLPTVLDSLSSEGLNWPLEIEPGRSVLVHRVADIPAPPAFVFKAFVSSKPLAAARCETIDSSLASCRVSRGGPVDRAPCVPVIGSSEKAVPALRPPRAVRLRVRSKVRREPSRCALRSTAIAPQAGLSGPEIAQALGELVEAFAEEPHACDPTLLQASTG